MFHVKQDLGVVIGWWLVALLPFADVSRETMCENLENSSPKINP